MAANAQSRNRRLAHVAVLERQGYFSEESMRMRAPLLYATYVGRYEATASEGGEGREVLLSAELLRRADEALADERLAKDQRRLAAEEVDPSSDEEDERRAGAEEEVVPHDSLVAELRELMLARYLGGKETDINYAVIDADASLDDAWQRTADQDAEDAYFATE